MASQDQGAALPPNTRAPIGAVAQVVAFAVVASAWTRSPAVFPEWAWLTDILLALTAVLALRASRSAATLPLSPLLAMAIVLIVASNLAAPDRGAALASTAAWARLLLAGLVGAALAATAGFARRAAWLLAAAGGAMSVHAALQVFVIHPALARDASVPPALASSFLDARANSVFLLPGHLASFLAMALCAALALALAGDASGAASGRAARAMAALLAALTLAGLFLSGSMGGALVAGFGIACLAMLGLSGRRRVVLLAVALLLPVLLVAPSRFRRQAEIAREDPGAARFANWATAARVVREAPLLGCGGGGYVHEHERLRGRTENDARNAHQGYLEAAAEHGALMLPLLAALLAAAASGAWRVASRRAADLPRAALHAAGACAFAHALIDFGWSDPAWGLPAALLVGTCLASGREPEPEGGLAAARPARELALAAALAILVLGIGIPASAGASLERRALAAGEEGRHEEALRLLDRARRAQPLDATLPALASSAHLALAAESHRPANERARNLEAAVSDARQAVDRSPRSASHRLTLARALRASGRRLEALAQASRAAQLAPHRAEALALRDLLAAQATP